MNCQYAQTISMMIDGELSESENEEIKIHLATCAACRQTEQKFLLLRERVKDTKTEYPCRTAEQSNATAESIISWRRGVLIPLPVLVLLLVFAAGAGIVLTAYKISRQTVAQTENAAGDSGAGSPYNNSGDVKTTDRFSLARFDKGARAEIDVIPRGIKGAGK